MSEKLLDFILCINIIYVFALAKSVINYGILSYGEEFLIDLYHFNLLHLNTYTSTNINM